MTRQCDLTGKTVQCGHKVSHSMRRTRKRFLPNVKKITAFSEILKKDISLKVAVNTMRSIDKNGGLDGYLIKLPNEQLSEDALRTKRQILKKMGEKA